MHRVSEVFDCWFESGSMPYAQQHYPFENQEVFAENFPADFVGFIFKVNTMEISINNAYNAQINIQTLLLLKMERKSFQFHLLKWPCETENLQIR